MNYHLELKNVKKDFGSTSIIRGVNLNIKKGEIHSLIGPNGAGKSSMLNVINGFYKPTSGKINFAGQERLQMEPEFAAKSGIARTFQNIALFKGMSTLDNLMTGRLLKQKQNLFMQALYIGPAEKEETFHREKVERVIDFLDLQSIRRTPVGSLPYGLQKRVELGRALAMEPEILLLDEPMAGMNVEEKQDVGLQVSINVDVSRTLGQATGEQIQQAKQKAAQRSCDLATLAENLVSEGRLQIQLDRKGWDRQGQIKISVVHNNHDGRLYFTKAGLHHDASPAPRRVNSKQKRDHRVGDDTGPTRRQQVALHLYGVSSVAAYQRSLTLTPVHQQDFPLPWSHVEDTWDTWQDTWQTLG